MRPVDTSLSRYGAERADVEALLGEWGEPRFRAEQLWTGLYDERLPLDAITTLPRTLRDALAEALPEALHPATVLTASDEQTTKWLWRTRRDGTEVETVLMRSERRATVCVSSQAGCAMGCTFCATGQAGLDRHQRRLAGFHGQCRGWRGAWRAALRAHRKPAPQSRRLRQHFGQRRGGQ